MNYQILINDHKFQAFFTKISIKRKIPDKIIINSHIFQSKILFHTQNKIIYPYLVFTNDDEHPVNYEIIESAENILRKHIEMKYRISALSIINPGVIYDWSVDDVLKIIDLLKIKELKLDKYSGKIIPENSKTGFMFNAKDSFINCEFCDHKNCKFRKKEFNLHKLDEIINEK